MVILVKVKSFTTIDRKLRSFCDNLFKAVLNFLNFNTNGMYQL